MTTQSPELAFFVAAFEHSVRSVLALAAELEEPDWDRPTELPGWSVRDVVAHLAAVESELLGRDRPPALASYGPHVRDEFGRHMEDGVQARRSLPVAAVVAELAGAVDERVAAMRAMRPGDPPRLVPAGAAWDTVTLLRNRAFDVWTHEQDVRRAVGRPGNLDGPGAQLARLVYAGALPYLVAKRAGARAGESLRLVVHGALTLDVTVAVGPDGRAAAVDAGEIVEPTATLRLDWETLVRLAGGRMAAAEAVVAAEGDEELGRRLVAGLSITP